MRYYLNLYIYLKGSLYDSISLNIPFVSGLSAKYFLPFKHNVVNSLHQKTKKELN